MKRLLIAISLLLVGCASNEKMTDNRSNQHSVQEQSDELPATFMLEADPSYLPPDNEQDAVVYIVDQHINKVHVRVPGKSFTEEELEQIDGMTAEEIDELIGLEEEEDPLHEIKYLEATRDFIVLEYTDERCEFTALSESVFENEAGIRYYLEENASISDYEDQLSGN